ncbi:MAG: phosphate ABC transporter permease PstA [Trueperaceae bacterium]|jgi:phosphate transport system permease protein
MNLKRRYMRDRLMLILIVLASLVVLTPLLIVLWYVASQGISALNIDFFTKDLGSPTRAQFGQATGLAQAIAGTFVIDMTALLMAVPVGIGAGMMLAEYKEHPLNPLLRVLNDTMNGMPAILKGLLIFTLVVRPSGTFSGFAGSLALGIVMLPIIARATEGALTLVPWSIREAGLALGLPRWRVILAAVLPVARPGLVTGVLIAFARAAGEAAPLLLTSLGNNFLPRNPWNPLEYLTKAADTLPQRLYSLAVSPYQQWHAMGWAAGIILLLLVIVVFLVGRWLTRRNH